MLRACAAAGETAPVRGAVACADIPARVAREERGRNRVLVFGRVADSDARIVGNLYGAPRRICRALGARSLAQLFQKLDVAIARPAALAPGAFPADEYRHVRAPDLTRHLPLIRYSQHDATPYLTSGIVLVRDPSSGRRHVCFARMPIVGGNRLLLNPATPRISEIVDATVGKGEALEAAVLIGAPAAVTLMACLTLPSVADKLEVAQALAGDALRYSDGRLPIPLATEYVLRGRVIPRYEREGPFGDLKGLYAYKARNPVFLVDELWRRRDPIFHSVSAGTSREHLGLVTLSARSYLERIKRERPDVLRYDVPRYAGARLAVLTVRPGFDRAALLARLWEVPIVRSFVLVDEDVSSRSGADLVWAIVERALDQERFVFGRHVVGGYQREKLAIDATAGDPRGWETRRVAVYRPGD